MILFDIEPLQNDGYKNRGIGRYVRNILSAARTAGLKFAVTYNPMLPPPDVSRLLVPERFIPATRSDFRAYPADWLVTMSPFEASLGATARLFRDCYPDARIATIVYDLIPMIFEGDYLHDPAARHAYDQGIRSMMTSDLMLCISDHTKSDVESMLRPPCPVISIGTGVDDFFFRHPNGGEEQRNLEQLSKQFPLLRSPGFIFTVTGGHKSKNMWRLLDAYANCSLDFRIAHPLVIGGGFGGDTRRHIEHEWQRMLADRNADKSPILVLPHIPDEQVRSLYRKCHLFVYASLYEGYGLPLAEAIVSGAVCVSSSSSSLSGILPLAEYQFSPMDTRAISQALCSGATNRESRERFHKWALERREDYRWQNVGARLIASLDVPAVQQASRTAPDVRTAVIGPLAGNMSGVARYNEEIAPHIVRDPHYSWFTPDNHFPIGRAANGYPVALLEQIWPRFDRVVYVVGNSPHHVPALRRMDHYPGHVWLHDVRLWGLAWDMANALSPRAPWQRINEWLASYPGRHPKVENMADLQASPVCFARALLSKAEGFVVHSEHARELLREDLGGWRDPRKIEVIAHACMPPEPAKPRDARDRIEVGLLGFMAPIRSPEVVIDAACQLIRAGTAVSLNVIGNCGEQYGKQLTARAAAGGVPMRITGYLESGQFNDEISALDVVVQLRAQTNGESSGTVAGALALGVPVVTNIPSVHEFWGELAISTSSLPGAEEVAQKIRLAGTPAYKDNFERSRYELLPRFSFSRVADDFRAAIDRLDQRSFADRVRARLIGGR